MPAPTVFRAAPEDAARIMAMQQRLFPGDVNSLTEADFVNDGVIILAAGPRAAPDGFLTLRARARRPWMAIDFVGTDEAARGKGVAGALLAAAIDASTRPLLRLFVRPSNAPALALYKRHGFRQTGRRKGSYEDGEDAIILMRWTGFGTG